MTFHPKILTDTQQQVLGILAPIATSHKMVLGGGTAIAIYLGHRRSIDFDWFVGPIFDDPMGLAQELDEAGLPFTTGSVDRGTLHGTMSGVRVSFLKLPRPWITEPAKWNDFGVSLASLDDLAAMKMLAVAQRGSRKDFTDIFALGINCFSLSEMLDRYRKKYAVDDVGRVLYALTFFDDAESEPLPEMLDDTKWEQVKQAMVQWVTELAS